MNAEQIIRKEYGNSGNFMTPNVIEYGKISRNIAYELSSGTGINYQKIWGVSVVVVKNGKTERSELSKCCHSEKEALDYINELKAKY